MKNPGRPATTAAWLLFAGLMAAGACVSGGPSGSSGGQRLASDQTLRFPILDDVSTLDPAHVSSGVTFTQEMFSGLYKFDDNLKVVPDIATGMPDVSSDGLTYTFHLRKDAKFWNGDPVNAKDFLYSWDRAAYLNDVYATVFDPVVGGPDTEARKTKTMSGLTNPDEYTIKAQLSAPAGYWLTELALWTANVVDQKVIEQADGTDVDKQSTWWTKPDTAVGTGPFKMTERTPKASMSFAPVGNWYRGSTGALKAVKVDIGIDQTSAVKKYESGGYDLVGMANSSPSPEDILRYKGDPTKEREVTIYPAARTTWVGFNEITGPFKGAIEGHDGRQAFSLAIDRDQLVDVACAKGATCQKATGGVISKGLKGYLGDGKDPNSVFNQASARSEYTKWDPDGSKVKGLQYRYNATPQNSQIAENLQSQWQASLGVKVELAPSDFQTLGRDRAAKRAVIFRGSWGADYDHPQDWFDFLFTCAQAGVGKGGSEGYCNPAMDKLVQEADGEQIDKAVPLYQQAGQQLITDAVDANLFYGTQTYITKPYVKGAGFNSLYDYSWTAIELLQH